VSKDCATPRRPQQPQQQLQPAASEVLVVEGDEPHEQKNQPPVAVEAEEAIFEQYEDATLEAERMLYQATPVGQRTVDCDAEVHACPRTFAAGRTLRPPQLGFRIRGASGVDQKNGRILVNITANGEKKWIEFHVVDVTRVIVSVAQLTDDGYRGGLDQAPVLVMRSGQQQSLQREGGLYLLKFESMGHESSLKRRVPGHTARVARGTEADMSTDIEEELAEVLRPALQELDVKQSSEAEVVAPKSSRDGGNFGQMDFVLQPDLSLLANIKALDQASESDLNASVTFRAVWRVAQTAGERALPWNVQARDPSVPAESSTTRPNSTAMPLRLLREYTGTPGRSGCAHRGDAAHEHSQGMACEQARTAWMDLQRPMSVVASAAEEESGGSEEPTRKFSAVSGAEASGGFQQQTQSADDLLMGQPDVGLPASGLVTLLHLVWQKTPERDVFSRTVTEEEPSTAEPELDVVHGCRGIDDSSRTAPEGQRSCERRVARTVGRCTAEGHLASCLTEKLRLEQARVMDSDPNHAWADEPREADEAAVFQRCTGLSRHVMLDRPEDVQHAVIPPAGHISCWLEELREPSGAISVRVATDSSAAKASAERLGIRTKHIELKRPFLAEDTTSGGCSWRRSGPRRIRRTCRPRRPADQGCDRVCRCCQACATTCGRRTGTPGSPSLWVSRQVRRARRSLCRRLGQLRGGLRGGASRHQQMPGAVAWMT
jgi:hypothetical protein